MVQRAGNNQPVSEVFLKGDHVISNCNRGDLVVKFKKAVVAIREKEGNITKVQVASELGCSRRQVSKNRGTLQQAVEELEAESPPPKFEANEEAECRLESGEGQFHHYPVVISTPLHWVPSKGWLYLVGKVSTTGMRKIFEKDLNRVTHSSKVDEGQVFMVSGFKKGDRITHSSKADEGRIFVVTGFKKAVDGDHPYYILAREERCETAVNCPFNPSKINRI